MGILNFLGALVALLVGALILNFVSQALEGRKTYFLHFGYVTMILVVGAAFFPFLGWTSTAWVLGVMTVWSILPPLWQQLFGDVKPSGYFWHGDDPEPPDAEADAYEADSEPK